MTILSVPVQYKNSEVACCNFFDAEIQHFPQENNCGDGHFRDNELFTLLNPDSIP